MATLTGKIVYLTGAGGFVGRYALAALVAAGAKVVAPVRSGPARRRVAAIGGAALLDRAEKVDAVVHLAYDVRASGQENLRYLDEIQQTAAALGADHFVHLSSIVVYDDWPDGEVDEESSITPESDLSYRGAKIAMENRLMTVSGGCTILQPTLVYGPGSALWTETFVAALRGGTVEIPEEEGLCHGVYVEDVARAIVSAVTNGTGQRRLIVSGPEPFRWSELLGGYATAVGMGGQLQRVPNAELERNWPAKMEAQMPTGPSLAARVSHIGRRLIGSERFEALVRTARKAIGGAPHYRPDRHVYELMCARGSVSIEAAAREIDHTPIFGLPEALADMKDALSTER